VAGERTAEEELLAAKQEIVDRHGAWTSHNIRLADGVYTRGPGRYGDEWRVLRVVQLLEDLLGSVEGLRVLDLACLEGIYSIELGLRGAEVVGIEGRAENVARARFAQEALGLERVEFLQEDVRNLSRERHGEFDVVLCIGILYHLDAPDVFRFLDSVGAVCRRLAVVDTHVALAPRETRAYDGRTYAGPPFLEHDPARRRTSGCATSGPRSTTRSASGLPSRLFSASSSAPASRPCPR
jgi:SAM-dependent methyltransferase